jgi:hypothetical protein
LKTSKRIPLSEQQAIENSEWLFKIDTRTAIESLYRTADPYVSKTILGFIKAKASLKGCI